MWRPFACNFASHAFDNFLRKIGRAESAPAAKREVIETTREKRNKSVAKISEEAEHFIQEFKNLKKKVKNQREQIKIVDLTIKRHQENKMSLLRETKIKERLKKKQEMLRIRAFSKCKPSRTANSASFRSHMQKKSLRSEIFGLTTPFEYERQRSNKSPLPKLRIHNLEPTELMKDVKTNQDYKNFPEKHVKTPELSKFLPKMRKRLPQSSSPQKF